MHLGRGKEYLGAKLVVRTNIRLHVVLYSHSFLPCLAL